MQPEDKLQQQAAIARHQAQSQKAKQYNWQTDSSATIIGYNAALGKNLIQLSDGSISYAGSDTNGATSLGSQVPLHSGTMRVDGLPYIKKQPVVVKKQPLPKVTYPIKVLFSVINEETGMRDFYIGGDRTSPMLIHSIPGDRLVAEARITNTGVNKNDWIIYISSVSNDSGGGN